MKKNTSMPARIARLAMMIALALVLGYIERLIPLPVPVPGIKLGLPNLVTLACLCLFGWRDALAVSALRVLLSGLLFGSGFSMLYALSGALLSLMAMALLWRTGAFSPVSVSAAGGLFHNLGQLLVALLVTRASGLLYYLPVLLFLGEITGVITGFVASLLVRRLNALLA